MFVGLNGRTFIRVKRREVWVLGIFVLLRLYYLKKIVEDDSGTISIGCQYFRAKYFPSGFDCKTVIPLGASMIWKGLVSGAFMLSKGCKFAIGNGKNVSIWDDPELLGLTHLR